MTLVEKIEKGLTCVVTGDNGKLVLFDSLFDNYFSDDSEYEVILENVNKVVNFYNESDNGDDLLNMEVSDILEQLIN